MIEISQGDIIHNKNTSKDDSCQLMSTHYLQGNVTYALHVESLQQRYKSHHSHIQVKTPTQELENLLINKWQRQDLNSGSLLCNCDWCTWELLPVICPSDSGQLSFKNS